MPLESIVLNPEQIRGVLDAAGSAAERSKDDNNLTETELDNAAGSRPDSHWQYTMVRRGDNLSLLFNRFGLSAREVHAVVSTEGAGAELARLLPGQRVGLQIDEDGDLRGLHLQINHLSEIEYKHQGEGFERIETNHIPERRTLYRRAMVENSLFLAGAGAGLSDDLIMDLAGIFSGVIDFVFDPRTGDSFSVLYEELWLGGQAIGNGNILAAEYVNQGKHYSAFRYVDRQGISGYFDPEGVSMQKTFLRAPLDFSRVSSNFNLRRRHPIHKRVTAHRGVDYAAPVGTPVFSAGDGRVVKATYDRANGHHVFIKHNDKYTTKYLHLSKRKVVPGQSVKQKQVIGTVGATGLATGPHLHYEFIVNGVHRNPRTIIDQLPRAKSIEAAGLNRFVTTMQPFQVQLASYRDAWQLASGPTTAAE